VKSPQLLIEDIVAGGAGAVHVEATPFTLNASKPTLPLENWNFTARLNVTADTVKVFEPSVKGVAGPKKLFPLAVVLKTLTLAPAVGSDVTLIVKV